MKTMNLVVLLVLMLTVASVVVSAEKNDNQNCDQGDSVSVDHECDNGYDVPEFSAIAGGLGLVGAGVGYITLRRRK